MTSSRNDAGFGASASTAPRASAHSGEVRRILVVDDNEDAAELLRELLACLGHDVAVANDGLTALKLAETFEPDIALLDIGMPLMNGCELAARLREGWRADKPLRLIAVTGYAAEVLSPEDGFETHLVKPFDLDKLKELIVRPPQATPLDAATLDAATLDAAVVDATPFPTTPRRAGEPRR